MLLLLTTSCSRSLKGLMQIPQLPIMNNMQQNHLQPISLNPHKNKYPNNQKSLISKQILLNTKTSLWMKNEEPTLTISLLPLRQSFTVRGSGQPLGWYLKIRVLTHRKEWLITNWSRVHIRWKLSQWLIVLAHKITKIMLRKGRSRILKWW